MIAASVWIAPAIEKPVSDSIDAVEAEMTPTDSDCGSPKGEPIARPARRPSATRDEPSGSGRSVSPAGSMRSSATSEFGSTPTIFASTWLPSANCT